MRWNYNHNRDAEMYSDSEKTDGIEMGKKLLLRKTERRKRWWIVKQKIEIKMI